MARRTLPTVCFDGQRMFADMVAKGWSVVDLARVAGVSQRTAYRFLRSDIQTARAGIALTRALGRSPKHYFMTQEAA